MTIQSIPITPNPYSGSFKPGDVLVDYVFYTLVSQVTIRAVGETGDTITYSGSDANTGLAGQQRNLTAGQRTQTIITCTPSEGSATTVTINMAPDPNPGKVISDALAGMGDIGTVSKALVMASGAPTADATTFSTVLSETYTDDDGEAASIWETVARFTAEDTSDRRGLAEKRRQRFLALAAQTVAAAGNKYQVLTAEVDRAASWTSDSYGQARLRTVAYGPLINP